MGSTMSDAAPMRERIAAKDWAETPLGGAEGWPGTLRTMVHVILSSSMPMAILWGPDAILIYNDRYAEVLGDRHPAALGATGLAPELVREVWSAGSLAQDASYSPIPGDDGVVAGILRVLPDDQARTGFLLRLSDTLAPLRDPAAIQDAAARAFADHAGVDEARFLDFAVDERAAGQEFDADALERLRLGEVVVAVDARSIATGLARDGRLAGVFLAARSDAREWSAGEIALLRETAERTWSSVERARAALLESDSVRRRLHHRFKNDLQLIASLINLQANRLDSDGARLLTKSRDRVYSIAAIHEVLHRLRGFAAVDARPYLGELLRQLVPLHDGAQRVGLQLEVDPIMIEPERAAPLGLLLNELVSNVCAHAFPKGGRGEIEIRYARQGEHDVLTVADTGVGFPPGFDIRRTDTLGLRLVQMLAQQLGGEVETLPGSGVRIQARFPSAEGGSL